MRFYLVFGHTFMILREILKKKTVKFSDRKGPPLQFEVKKMVKKSKNILKNQNVC